MATKNTVEEHILKLLYEKINLFERVIGELDSILAKLDLRNIHEHIEDIMIQSSSEGEMKIKMENLAAILNFGEQLQQAENN